jgi:hypothetical protein
MGLFDKLTGTKHPEVGVAPCSVDEVRTALLGLNRPDVPYVIRGGSAEGADLVAEWRMTEPAWQTFFVESQLTRAVRIRMRLVQKDREVRVIEEGWEVTRVGNPPRLQISGSYSRGPDKTVSRNYRVERQNDGRLETTETFRFNAADLRNPLEDVVLKSGWTWRGVLIGKL